MSFSAVVRRVYIIAKAVTSLFPPIFARTWTSCERPSSSMRFHLSVQGGVVRFPCLSHVTVLLIMRIGSQIQITFQTQIQAWYSAIKLSLHSLALLPILPPISLKKTIDQDYFTFIILCWAAVQKVEQYKCTTGIILLLPRFRAS